MTLGVLTRYTSVGPSCVVHSAVNENNMNTTCLAMLSLQEGRTG